ncbi:MAG: RecB family exonuclease [Frankiaceae bacterium]
MTTIEDRPVTGAATGAVAGAAVPAGQVVDLPAPVVGSLSPSRAADFMNCPLLYKLRVIDRLPEPPSPAAARGTMVHAVLERLFDLPAAERTLAAAADLLDPAWDRLVAEEPALADLVAADDPAARAAWLADARELLAGYFTLEDPRRLEPAQREHRVEVVIDGGLVLRGYVDRLDEAPTGELRVVDYKTGRAPGESFEAKALFQMKFYALVLWRTRGRVPRELRLIYLGDRDMLRYSPTEDELVALERKLRALWAAIERATATGDWRARPGKLCDWCAHRHVNCTAFPVDEEQRAAYEAWRARLAPAEDG